MTRLAVVGFAIWLGATIALRLVGQWIIHPGTAVGAGILLAASGVLMWQLPRGVFASLRVARQDYALGAIVLVAPGMLLDTISAIAFARVFPNIPPEAAGLFGGWLLFCNIIALLSGASAARGHDPGAPAAQLRHR